MQHTPGGKPQQKPILPPEIILTGSAASGYTRSAARIHLGGGGAGGGGGGGGRGRGGGAGS